MKPSVRLFIVYLLMSTFFFYGLLKTYFSLPVGPWMYGLLAMNLILVSLFSIMGEGMIEDLVKGLLLGVASLAIGYQFVQWQWLHFNVGYAVFVSIFFAMVTNVAVRSAKESENKEN